MQSADAQKKLLDDTVSAYSEALGLTKNRFVGGAAPKADVAQAQTQLDTARVTSCMCKLNCGDSAMLFDEACNPSERSDVLL